MDTSTLPLANKLYFLLQKIFQNIDWSYSILSTFFFLLLQGRPPSKKAKVLNKVNKAPPPPVTTEGKDKTQIISRNTSNACLHSFPPIGNSPGFDWGAYLDKETSVAASVTCFRHVSIQLYVINVSESHKRAHTNDLYERCLTSCRSPCVSSGTTLL